MKHTELREQAEKHLASVEPGADREVYATLWASVARCAAAGLKLAGIDILRDETAQEPPEEIGELKHGWASTPVEVLGWCADHGIPHEISGKAVIVARFDSRPDKETRTALKAAGFKYVKARRSWEHKGFGQFGNSAKVKAWRQGEREDLPKSPRRQPVTWDADDGGPGQDYVSAHQDLASGLGGGW